MEILSFFAGVSFFYFKNGLSILFFASLFFFRKKLGLVVSFIVALLWCFIHQTWISDTNMPHTALIKNAELQGYVASIPQQNPTKTQFQLLVNRLNKKPVQTNMLLSCYKNCPEIHAGDYLRLKAKVKKPVNLENPGGFDYVAWLHSRHIQWVGQFDAKSVVISQPKHLMQYRLLKSRESIENHLSKLNADKKTLGIIEALTLGITNSIDKSQWDLFRRTGTTHLIDISGEHIALIAGISYRFIKWTWKHLGDICLRYPASKIASAGSMSIAFLYALIAGFAVPTQRALITCCCMLMRNFYSQPFSIWQSWRYALLLVLLLEPHSVYMLGFYFSFIAVAILILINQRIKLKGFYKMLSMQMACMLGLMPLSLYWFSYGSINGLIANLIAIPLVSFFIVPLALIVTFLSPWFVIPGSIFVLNTSIHSLLWCLQKIDSLIPLNIHFTFTEAIFPIAMILGMAITIFFPMMRLLPATCILSFATLFPHHEKVNPGHVVIDVLDVGQGLAVVVRTAHHALIYDTGMQFYQGSDMGKLVILPYLNLLGVRQLDKIIISHPDLDHRGGLTSIEAQYPNHELIVDDPLFYHRGVTCHQHADWDWDGIRFKFFTITPRLKGKNNNSCILQVSNSAGQMLLSGDIEWLAEEYLIKTYGKKLASTILLIPHHGSKTSSSKEFINRVNPNYAIVSYGFDNRYHFPHPEALRNYSIPIFNTMDCGRVRVNLSEGTESPPSCYRSINQIIHHQQAV